MHSGAAGPLAGPTRDAVHVHGAEGLDGVEIPVPPAHGATATDGPGFILESADSHAWALDRRGRAAHERRARAPARSRPRRRRSPASRSWAGEPSATPRAVAEFNIWADPEAADEVFRSRRADPPVRPRPHAPGLRRRATSSRAIERPRDAARRRSSPGCSAFYVQRILELVGDSDLAALHDPCAVLAVTHPELFGFGDAPGADRARRHATRAA